MKYGRRRRSAGFTKAGNLDPGKLEMPASRALDLQYRHAWEKAAGPEIVSRLRFVRVFRRTLELACVESHWSGPVRSILPLVAARFAELAPAARIMKFRIVSRESPGPSHRIEEGPIAAAGSHSPPGSNRPSATENGAAERSTSDIQEVARKYLRSHAENGEAS